MTSFKMSQKGLDLLKSFESCKLEAYLDSVGKPTIGWGSTFYADGTRVKMGDIISQKGADDLLALTLPNYEKTVNANVISNINQSQFDALVDFAYNEGNSSFVTSTLLKEINKNPNDPDIKHQFLRWDWIATGELSGLERRRLAEYTLYSSI